MAEEKKKKSIKETLAELRSMGTSSESFKKQSEQSKQETLAASKNKKLADAAKKQLQINKNKEEDDRASSAMKESRKTIEALSNRATLRNYGGSSGPAETEGEVTNPAKPKPKTEAAKPKPKPKPQQAAPVKPTAPAKPETSKTAEVKPNNKRFTSAQSTLFIGPDAKKAQAAYTPQSKPPRPKSSDFPPTARGTEQFAAALRSWKKKYG